MNEHINKLKSRQYTWLITGVAGFIGSNILEKLLTENQNVIGIDNLSTGHKHNLDDVKHKVGPAAYQNFTFTYGDVTDYETCQRMAQNVDFVLHQAALGSVPRSIEDPVTTNNANVTGHLNMLTASKDAQVKSFIYAASSSTYGDHAALPKQEENIGKPLSPYAVTKYINELYSDVFSRTYNFNSTGLRYFNVFGPRQSPNGAYAAVIPRWIETLINGEQITINGDGTTSRDFTYIDNVVEANILAALQGINLKQHILNVACGTETTLNELYEMIQTELRRHQITAKATPIHLPFRKGDVLRSLASIDKAKKHINYEPKISISEGMKLTVDWHIKNQSQQQ